MHRQRLANLHVARFVTALTMAVLLTGCVLSIQPSIPDDQSVFQPGLLGTWVEADGKDSAVVTRMGETGYRIRYTDDDGKAGTFEGHTGRLGDDLILEVAPAAPRGDFSDDYLAALLPGRLVFVIVPGSAEVRTATLRVDTLRNYLQHRDTWTPHLARVEHFGEGDPLVLLTGTTAELRTWLGWYLDRPGVLNEETVWRKVRP